jgi:hypothetical protein
MKIVQVVPRLDIDESLKSMMKAKERALRGGTTAFRRKREGQWVHIKYKGVVRWEEVQGGIVIAQIRASEEDDWQLLRAFVGYLDRHFRDAIESMTIYYR